MHWLVQVHRNHRGIFRTAFSEPVHIPVFWAPLMRRRGQIDGLVYALLASGLHAGSTGLPQARVRFAFQMVFSTLVNAEVHDAGPLRLHDPTPAPELARSLLAPVGVTAPAG